MNSILVRCPVGWDIPSHSLPSFASELDENRICIDFISDTEAKITIKAAERLIENTEIIPCLSIPTNSKYGYQAQLTYRNGAIENSVRLAGIGETPKEFLKEEIGSEEVSSDVDLFLTKRPIQDVCIEFNIVANGVSNILGDSQYLVAISITVLSDSNNVANRKIFDVAELEVPQKSQMTFPENIRRRICSPTSIYMVEDYYGVKSDVVEIADKAYNSIHDMYGIWPQNIWAISNKDIVGYICRIPNFYEVARLLKSGIPLIASINYKRGELTNAAIDQTPGHLVVVVGLRGEYVICNDPAASSDSNVRRKYKINEFRKVWIEKKGVAYVLIKRR